MNRLISFTVAVCLILASETICLDESIMTHLHSKEDYSDVYSESIDDITERQRSLNPEELKEWGLRDIIKLNGPTLKKVPNSAANLPLRFGRKIQTERSTKPAANLPLRFGRASAGNLFRYTHPLPHHFERPPSITSSFHSLDNLSQRFGRSFLFSLPHGFQDPPDQDQDV